MLEVETVDRILRLDGGGLPVLSLYARCKPDYAAGMREHATRNKADLLAKRHYRAVAERLAEDTRRREFDIVAVGGHEHEVPEFLGHLAADVRERVAGTFAVHPREDDLGRFRSRAEEIVQRYERAEEQRLVADTPLYAHVVAASLRFPLPPHPAG